MAETWSGPASSVDKSLQPPKRSNNEWQTWKRERKGSGEGGREREDNRCWQKFRQKKANECSTGWFGNSVLCCTANKIPQSTEESKQKKILWNKVTNCNILGTKKTLFSLGQRLPLKSALGASITDAQATDGTDSGIPRNPNGCWFPLGQKL